MIGTTLQIVGESLCEAVDVAAGERVLDVAAGNGNATLAAARRGGEVTASDYVPALLEGTRARAAAEGLRVDVREADAEALPFADATFDAVLSTFGVMFTPNQEQAACRARTGVPAGWAHRPGQLDARRVRRSDVQDRRTLRAAARGHRLAAVVGNRGAPGRDARRRRPGRSRRNAASSCSGTARPRSGSTCSATTTDRPTRRSPHSTPTRKQDFARDLLALANEHNTSPTGLRIPAEYLEIVATKTR